MGRTVPDLIAWVSTESTNFSVCKVRFANISSQSKSDLTNWAYAVRLIRSDLANQVWKIYLTLDLLLAKSYQVATFF
jgi:hypothetical protein